MRYLGIDYGEKKVGLALSEGILARPYKILERGERGKKWFFSQIKGIVEEEGVEKVVVGVSEGKMGKKTEEFIEGLKEILKIEVEREDETLTSRRAVAKMVNSAMKKSKRRKMKDSVAAALILQDYLDREKNNGFS